MNIKEYISVRIARRMNTVLNRENYLVEAHITFISSDGRTFFKMVDLPAGSLSFKESDCLRILLLCASPLNRFTLFLRERKAKPGLLASKKLPISATPILFPTFSLRESPLEVAAKNLWNWWVKWIRGILVRITTFQFCRFR